MMVQSPMTGSPGQSDLTSFSITILNDTLRAVFIPTLLQTQITFHLQTLRPGLYTTTHTTSTSSNQTIYQDTTLQLVYHSFHCIHPHIRHHSHIQSDILTTNSKHHPTLDILSSGIAVLGLRAQVFHILLHTNATKPSRYGLLNSLFSYTYHHCLQILTNCMNIEPPNW